MYIGIDLGGTNIAAGIVDKDGNILAKSSVPTPCMDDYTIIVKAMLKLSKELVEKANITFENILSVGIGCPGSIDDKNGVVSYSNNLKMDNAPIVEEFQKYWDIPVVLENDANAAAFGEYIVNGKNAEVFVAITLGTGVGGGVVISGKLFKGFNGAGAELGHSVIMYNGNLCTCGNRGCWETYASATALINQTSDAMKLHPESLMHKVSKEYGEINGRVAFDAAKSGDKTALEVVQNYANYVAVGLVNVVNTFQPNKIVVGGGVSNEGEYLMNPVREYVKKYDYNKHFEKVQIEAATLKNDAGIIGAALLAK